MVDPPFAAPVIPEFAHDTDRMAYIYVTEYVANSAWYAALSSRQHQLTVHENTVSYYLLSSVNSYFAITTDADSVGRRR